MARTLCFIPARGGSKRIPRKSLQLLNGKPLLAYTIETALQTQIFDAVVVSSDDREILDLAISLGAIPDQRPDRLSGDRVPFMQVLEEYLRPPCYWQNVASMLCTCPFCTVGDVQAAYELFLRRKLPVIAVTEYEFPPQFALHLSEDNEAFMRDPGVYWFTTQSQCVNNLHHPTGSFYLATVEDFMREGTYFTEPFLGYEMPRERSLDIDYPYQLRIAECMIQ